VQCTTIFCPYTCIHLKVVPSDFWLTFKFYYGILIYQFRIVSYFKLTRSSSIAKRPCDTSCQLKSCQLPCNSAETTCTTNPEQIEVMKFEGYSGLICSEHVHSTMTRSRLFDCLVGVKQNRLRTELWIYPYTDDLLWRNFLSPQCRNCSRDPDHAHLGYTHSSQD